MSKIEWTDETWNPTRGCSRVSPGCDHCYAIREARRHDHAGGAYEGLTRLRKKDDELDWSGRVKFVQDVLAKPLRWTKPRLVFVNSMSDLFHEKFTNEQIAAVFGVMAASPTHTFQVLTKRAKRMRQWVRWIENDADGAVDGCLLHAQDHLGIVRTGGKWAPPGTPWPLPNVWLGVSVEDQARADERIPHLVETPAVVRFVSCEPLLGPVNLTRIVSQRFPTNPPGHVEFDGLRGYVGGPRPEDDTPAVRGLQWVIVGGESGPKARPYERAWAGAIIEHCRHAGVACFHKQMGAHVLDRNDAGFEGEHSGEWPDGTLVGTSERWQGAPCRVTLRHPKGADPGEWPESLRVRQYPEAS